MQTVSEEIVTPLLLKLKSPWQMDLKMFRFGGFIGGWGGGRAPPVVEAATAAKRLLAQVESLPVQHSTFIRTDKVLWAVLLTLLLATCTHLMLRKYT